MVASTATNQISTSYLCIYHKTHQQQKHDVDKDIPVNQILNDLKNECVAFGT